MRISEMNWMMVEEYLKRDDRCVLAAREYRAACLLEFKRR